MPLLTVVAIVVERLESDIPLVNGHGFLCKAVKKGWLGFPLQRALTLVAELFVAI